MTMYKHQNAVNNITRTQEELCEVNKAIKTLKALVNEGCTDIELYKIVIEQDLKYI